MILQLKYILGNNIGSQKSQDAITWINTITTWDHNMGSKQLQYNITTWNEYKHIGLSQQGIITNPT